MCHVLESMKVMPQASHSFGERFNVDHGASLFCPPPPLLCASAALLGNSSSGRICFHVGSCRAPMMYICSSRPSIVLMTTINNKLAASTRPIRSMACRNVTTCICGSAWMHDQSQACRSARSVANSDMPRCTETVLQSRQMHMCVHSGCCTCMSVMHGCWSNGMPYQSPRCPSCLKACCAASALASNGGCPAASPPPSALATGDAAAGGRRSIR